MIFLNSDFVRGTLPSHSSCPQSPIVFDYIIQSFVPPGKAWFSVVEFQLQ